MKTVKIRLLALFLALCLTLTGCTGVDFRGYFKNLYDYLNGVVTFDSMEYIRPDMDAYGLALNKICEKAVTETNIDTLVEGIWEYYDVYDAFSTAYALANIHYFQDLTDSYWEDEYNFCAENAASVDAGLDRLYRALAHSPIRAELEGPDYFGPGFFEAYEEESIYDEAFVALLEQESGLISQYYTLSADLYATGESYNEAVVGALADLYVQLVQLRQQIAAYAGYGNYVSFASDFYYYRDYTPQQAETYLAEIRNILSPLYKELDAGNFWDTELPPSTELLTFAYLRSAAQHMGGPVLEAFETMDTYELYDITQSPNKHVTSFEVYLPSYYVPFVFVCPGGSSYDSLLFAHEFGHFCCDYASYGSVAGVDVAEVFSQGMEYLSLCYADGGEEMAKIKLFDCLCLYVEQAALASFEQQVYSLSGSALTTENVESLYTQVCADFGLVTGDWDSRSYLGIPHFFTNPMYIISYVVSNDAALQLYEMEQEDAGTGLACLETNLATTQGYFLAFLEEAGLDSPFTPGRLTKVRDLLKEQLSR
jgi:oligoendopeptidase F